MFCVPCWFSFIDRSQAPEKTQIQTTAAQATGDWIPWQKWQEEGVTSAFFSTLQMLSRKPERLFSRISTQSNYTTPIVFAFLCIVLFWFPMKMFYLKLAMPYMISYVDSVNASAEEGAAVYDFPVELREQYELVSQQPLGVFLLMPIHFLVLNVLLTSVLQQLLIRFFQGQGNYLETLQIRCYSMGAQCLQLIPFFGIVLSEVVVLVLCTRGFQMVQKLPRWRAFLVASLPLLLSMALYI